jgi:hypothetical protein
MIKKMLAPKARLKPAYPAAQIDLSQDNFAGVSAIITPRKSQLL